MKFTCTALLGLLTVSAFATSPMHPYAQSSGEIQAVLKDPAVQKKLFAYSSPVTSVTHEKLRHGKHGWVVTTDKCALEVEVEYRQGKMDPRLPGGFHVTQHIHAHDCR